MGALEEEIHNFVTVLVTMVYFLVKLALVCYVLLRFYSYANIAIQNTCMIQHC